MAGINSYTKSLGHFLARQEARSKERWDVLSKRLARATETLTQKFPAITYVGVIGSFLTPSLFREDSDVDIVTCGLSRDDYFEAFFLLEQELNSPVDLIRREETPTSLQLRLENALVLYGE